MSDRRRLALSLAGLGALFVLVIVAGDSRAWSGSDAGGKVATVRQMADTRSWSPDVGYWAARYDPQGLDHPLLYTQHIDGRWIQATSVPYVYAGVPLWRLGGPAGLLALPVAGSLLAAYAARRLARALGGRGWGAFWLVGTGPLLFYAGDFWEHSMAVGLALLAVALAFEGGTGRAVVAGLVGGAAIVMRTEVALAFAALGVAVLIAPAERREWLRRPRRLVGAIAGLVAVVAANDAVERAVLGQSLRSSRGGSNIASAGTDLGARLSDAVLTALGVLSDDTGRAFVVGALLVAGLAVLGTGLLRGREAGFRWRAGAAVAGALYLVRFLPLGLVGFVPGAIPAAPAGAAAVAARPGRERLVALAAVAALPPVWLLSWRGQLLPQWGGRYVLLTAALLTVVGSLAMERAGWRQPPVIVLVALAVVVSGFAATWHVQRTINVGRAISSIEAAPRDVVVISRFAHLGREGGAWYGRHRWLNAQATGGTPRAAAIAAAAGVRRIDVVGADAAAPALHGWRVVGTRRVPYFGLYLVVARYQRAPTLP